MYAHIHIHIYTYIYTFISGFFCTALKCSWQAKNSGCTDLHGPAGKATMPGLARRTCKWVPTFTYFHGTTRKVRVHVDAHLALLMRLNSWIWICHCLSKPYQIMGQACHGTTLPMASIGPRLHGFARPHACADLHEPALMPRCTGLHGKRAMGSLHARNCTDSMQLPCHCHVGARHCTAIS